MYPAKWWALYQAAILETNRDKLEERIGAAEEAIGQRCSQDGDVSPDERVVLDDALTGLTILKQEHRDNLRRNQ